MQPVTPGGKNPHLQSAALKIPGDRRKVPLDIVTACRARDVPILRLAAENLRRYVPFKQLHVITAKGNFSRCARALGPETALIDEDLLIPGMTLRELRSLPEPDFPAGAGWYFQQLLKYAFAYRNPEIDYYLIWDADTVPLRAMEFFDQEGRMLFTTAEEYNPPYFETYRNLLGHDANREFSFIAQHMVIRKSILREMLRLIEEGSSGDGNWAWKIMRGLSKTGGNRFSEYETFGHYVKNEHPEEASFRQLPWSRDGTRIISHRRPAQADLDRLGETYVFAAFEGTQTWPRRALHAVGKKLRLSQLLSSLRNL